MNCKTCIQNIPNFIKNSTTPIVVENPVFNNLVIGNIFYCTPKKYISSNKYLLIF